MDDWPTRPKLLTPPPHPTYSATKNRELVRHVDALETIVVGSEAEALILEANLIKEHRPRFNILLRDDKKYPHIKVTLREPFPRVYVTRRVVNERPSRIGSTVYTIGCPPFPGRRK